jgi:hypothetical protein
MVLDKQCWPGPGIPMHSISSNIAPTLTISAGGRCVNRACLVLGSMACLHVALLESPLLLTSWISATACKGGRPSLLPTVLSICCTGEDDGAPDLLLLLLLPGAVLLPWLGLLGLGLGLEAMLAASMSCKRLDEAIKGRYRDLSPALLPATIRSTYV